MNILKNWVTGIGLRHQGILVSAIRGSDALPKEDPAKDLVRCYRGIILNSFDKNPSRFIDLVSMNETKERMIKLLDGFDHYPLHFILHLVYAAEIVGYKHPRKDIRNLWIWFYASFVYKIHLNIETEREMDERLNAGETEFAERDTRCYNH